MNHKIIQVPYIDQSVKYPTGCESVSTVMLLQYLGYDISVDKFIADYLEMKAFEERGKYSCLKFPLQQMLKFVFSNVRLCKPKIHLCHTQGQELFR